MQNLRSHPVSRNIIHTTMYLVVVSGLSFLVLAAIFTILGLRGANGFLLLFLLMGLGAFIGGTFWARSVIQMPKSGKIWRAAFISGFAFGTMVFVAGYTLETIEQDLFRRNLLNAPGIHTQFIGLFSLAIFSVAGITSAVVAFQSTGGRQAISYALITAIASAAVFIAVDLAMYGLGW